MKKYVYSIVVILSIATVLSACDKNGNVPGNCFPDQQTIRVLNNKTATVNQSTGVWYLVEEFTYDTKLYPCNLPKEYQVEKLVVQVSGNVKAIPQTDIAPCCIDGLEITGISTRKE